MSSLDYLDLCRLCLVKDRVSVPIFEGEGDVRQIFLKIAACLPVKVGREDKLPKKICDDCVYKVELFYQFWNTTANAEKQLLQWLGEVSMDDKQGYVTGAHDPSMMKPGQNTGENRLDGSSVMQQVNEHTNNMGMGMMDGMGIGMPMMIPNSGQQPQQQQMTSVPMDTGGNAVQNVQPVPGPSAQIGQQKINAPTNEDEDEDESEEEDNSDDECDGDDGLPVKEESEDEPNRTIEPTTFVNVSLACDEAGPSGLQQQKIGEMPEMVMPPTDGDPKSGYIAPDPLGPDFLTVKIMDDIFRIPKSLCYFMVKEPLNRGDEAVLAEKLKSRENEAESEESGSRKSIEEGSKERLMVRAEKENKVEAERENQRVRKHTAMPVVAESSSKSGKATNQRLVEKNCRVLDAVRPAACNSEPRKTKAERKGEKIRESVTYECETCSLKFARKREYTIHMVNHSTLRSHKCDICEKAFKRKSELKCHVQLHSGIKYNCDECDFVTTSKVAVRYHVRRVHQRDFRYKCEQCDKSFMSNCELKDHRTSHSNTKSFICEICGKAYLQKSYLGAHKRTVHGLVQRILTKDHRCSICNKNFVSEYILQNHIGIHSRKFLCPHCGKEFANNQSLAMHNRMHTGERPYSCRMCSKSFVRSNALAVHELTHSGKRPYVCDLCGKNFTQRSTMMGHRKKHPGTHPPPPPTLLSKLEGSIGSNS
ncbi:zinc finger protein 354C-like isoform X12 [Venturia canescens]|uniref:zinc finger protein 354C-like isoform X12 n=1 Tax=Venturia canescens TaxID=32260 RepID=UPI001C9CE255|nr:zinc finger protein 354C-like isoform X12 [Venturia canescens]XP_043273997.1 zinc finger protein 354C-like isoform X12 [Venturia canescens]